VTFTESAECDGALVVAERECLVNLSTLRADPYVLEFKDQIVVRIQSLNAFGWSEWSEPATESAIVLIEPSLMQVPVYRPLFSTGETIHISLIELTEFDDIGGSPILAYKTEVSLADQDVWTEVATGLELEVSASGLTVGSSYKFRTSAQNIHGWGPTNDPLVVLATNVPEQPSPATVSI
jgi:hypothetical protein